MPPTTTPAAMSCASKDVAAATTDDVSLTAVPAHRPNEVGVNPNAMPSDGKMRAASTLYITMTATDMAIPVALALMTWLIVAMADAPQMVVPYVTRMPVSRSTFRARVSGMPAATATITVPSITGRPAPPMASTCVRDMPAPSRTMDVCRIRFELNLTPFDHSLRWPANWPISRPKTMPSTGAPMTGTCRPSTHATAPTRKGRA